MTQINMESVRCANVPVFLAFRDNGAPENLRQFPAKAPLYIVKRFAHGLHRESFGETPRLKTAIVAEPLDSLGALPAKDFPELPERKSWVNIAALGAKGDGQTDDTAVFERAITDHRAIYVPMGRYRFSDTLALKPDTALIGLNPQATQFVVLSKTPSFSDPARPKPVIETAKNGRNIFTGIGVEPGHNKGAIAIKWTAGEHSYMDDVYLPWSDRSIPKGSDQHFGLWVADGGGGTFKNLWFPDALAADGFRVTDTSTEGRVYMASVEHHVKAEITMNNVANWTWYALQTEENEGSDQAVSLDMKACKNISFVNYFIYRMPKTPFPYAIRLQQSSNINFRGLHNFHWRGLAFEAPLFEPEKNISVPEHELSYLQVK
jgi:polygalacturonase